MSNLKIEELFTVDASVETVWRFLREPAEVATCLPGARLDGAVEGEPDTYRGTMKVKVGPVVSEFRGKATVSEVNETKHSLKIAGSGADDGGGGSASLTLTCRVQPALEAAEGAAQCEVVVIAELEVAGKLLRFGRGMMEGVAKQMFKHFVSRARAKLTGSALPGGSSSQDIPSLPHEKSAPIAATRGFGISGSGSVTISPELLAAAAEPHPIASGSHEIHSGRQQAVPASERAAPAREKSGPAAQKVAPASENTAPASQNPAPASENTAPASQNIAPAAQNIAPASQNPAPAAQNIAPASQNAAPASDRSGPAVPKSAPARAESGPARALKAPELAPKQSGRSEALMPRPSDITTAIIPRSKLRADSGLPEKAAAAASKLAKDDVTLRAGGSPFAALWDWIKRLFGRLFGRAEERPDSRK